MFSCTIRKNRNRVQWNINLVTFSTFPCIYIWLLLCLFYSFCVSGHLSGCVLHFAFFSSLQTFSEFCIPWELRVFLGYLCWHLELLHCKMFTWSVLWVNNKFSNEVICHHNLHVGSGSTPGAWAGFLEHIPYGGIHWSAWCREEGFVSDSTEGTRLCRLLMGGLTILEEWIRVDPGMGWVGQAGRGMGGGVVVDM